MGAVHPCRTTPTVAVSPTDAGCFGDTAGGKGVKRMKKITIRKTGSIKLTSSAHCEVRC
jgi:hypothetical protein